jgi:hypothetical protein
MPNRFRCSWEAHHFGWKAILANITASEIPLPFG